MRRLSLAIASFCLLFAAVWLRSSSPESPAAGWREVSPHIFRSPGIPAAYAIVEGDRALLIGAARGARADELKSRGIKKIDLCLLTHHHRDTSALARQLIAAGIPVRAPKASADLLTPDGVRRYWNDSLQELTPGKKPVLRDRTFGIWSYLVHPEGIDGIACDLEDGREIDWRGWNLRVVATPGHSRDHVAFAVKKPSQDRGARPVVFCGDAFASPGKIWSPYTTDWHHAADEGLVAAARSLRRLAQFNPVLLCPEHGRPLANEVVAALNAAARNADEAAFLKSFERYTKDRVGHPPAYPFLAREQVATAGEKPWSRLSEHLYLTGNTFVLSSRDGPILVIDPFNPAIGDQVRKLQQDRKLGPIEVVLVSHAHNDHYTGLYELPQQHEFRVWTLDQVARPLTRPHYYYAPYLDVRPVKVDRLLTDGETVSWREYRFHIGHFPGQTVFTMGVQTVIDGKACFHTADNFFHADQFTGSGGWSGRNRAWPGYYAASAQVVLDARPDWVLAEHGGAFAFNAEDFRRRVRWAGEAARAADMLSPSGRHRRDWNPTRIQVEPMMQEAVPGGAVNARLVIENPLDRAETLTVELVGRQLVSAPPETLTVPAGKLATREISLAVSPGLPKGRHVFPLIAREGDAEDAADTFVVLEVR